jgi:hypothetical protein
MPHHDARKALHDPNPLSRQVAPPAPPITLDVARIARRLARTLAEHSGEQREMLKRAYVERLLDYLEDGERAYSPAQIDAATECFSEALEP